MSVLARPISPMFARMAKAAVLMNTLDYTVDVGAILDGLPGVPTTTLQQLLARRQAEVPN